jgi:hypothetical protein
MSVGKSWTDLHASLRMRPESTCKTNQCESDSQLRECSRGVDDMTVGRCAASNLGMNFNTVFFTFYHTLKDCDAMWIESQQQGVNRSAKKMPLALAKASVMVCVAS